jgi:hypothetical protein
MKNLIIALLLFPGSVFAQSFKGGVQGGITMSQVDGDRYAGFNKTGIWGELFVEYPFSENASMHIGIAGVQKGSYQQFDQQDFYRMSLVYVEVPVLYQYRILSSKAIFEGGLGFGILVDSKEKTELGLLPSIDSPNFNFFELSAQVGVKYFIWKKAGALARYSYSVIPIRDTGASGTYRRVSGQYNNLLQMALFYMF